MEAPPEKTWFSPKMPIGSLEEFEAIEKQLKNDELKDSLVHELRRHFVSNSERDTIFQIMPEVFGIFETRYLKVL
ncbi:hypothetical protein RN001_005528 [Aquatica leii]|uniref:Uncharacterized protein n=1 Tax=Aquatica leii TaxID=1421715 RepID=A0AAN7SIX9_9COLE|nr:hypothetical protein RN001_005528 [Aquatica leii]